MAAIIVYGSLIHPTQLAREALLGQACPIVVRGYRRVFHQEPAWRIGRGDQRAVLSVVPAADYDFNGLLVELRAGDALHQLDHRERGYERVAVDWQRLQAADGFALTIPQQPVSLYQGQSARRNDRLRPNEDYLALCLSGARHWSEDFYASFLQSTYVGELRLDEFLELAGES